MEVLDTSKMPASSVDLNKFHKVLEEIRISSTPFMANNQMNHQESGIDNLQHITSNPGPLLQKPVLQFQL